MGGACRTGPGATVATAAKRAAGIFGGPLPRKAAGGDDAPKRASSSSSSSRGDWRSDNSSSGSVSLNTSCSFSNRNGSSNGSSSNRGNGSSGCLLPAVDLSSTFYLLNPGGDLPETQHCFEKWFSSELAWEVRGPVACVAALTHVLQPRHIQGALTCK